MAKFSKYLLITTLIVLSVFIVGHKTHAAVSGSSYNFVLNQKQGITSGDVIELQKRLTSEGVYSGPVTGYFGTLTTNGVKAYQAKNGLPQTGVLDNATRAALNNSRIAMAPTNNVNREAIKAQVADLQAQVITLLQELLKTLQGQSH